MASLTENLPRRAARRPQAPAGPVVEEQARRLSHPVMIALFLLCATQPYSLLVGPYLMGPYRITLMIFSIPLIIGWVRGLYGGRILPDYMMLAHTLWISVALAANGQAERITEYGAAQMFDIFTAYLLGRAAIRSREDFYFFTKFFLAILLFLLPFAVIEATQGKMYLQDAFRQLPSIRPFHPTTIGYPQRLGLYRAQTTINHPIVYGVFCSIGFSFGIVGLKYARGGTGLLKRLVWTMGSYGGTFFSVSAGALVCVVVQLGLILWNATLRTMMFRWQVLATIMTIAYIVTDIVAVRPPLLVWARYVAFSGSTLWNRYLIWQFGTAEVGRHPIFGMGLFDDWIRARWMSPSIDNHWLLVAMRFGLPALILLLGAYFYIVIRLARQNYQGNDELSSIRYAFVFLFIGLFFSLGTVNSWHITYSLILMLMGGAVWLFNEPRDAAAAPEGQPARRGAQRRRDAAAGDAAGAESGPDSATDVRPPETSRRGPTYTRFPTGSGSIRR